MGASSKILSVCLRVWEFVCSCVVLGLVGRFLWHVGEANVYADARLIFAIIVASISTVASLLFMIPFTFTFLACPFDFILFALWLITFILLNLLTGINTCDAIWYYNYWGYYWGGFWRTPIIVAGPRDIHWAGCSSWKAILAFSFIAAMGYLLSTILGAYVIIKYREERKMAARAPRHRHKRDGGMFEEQAPPPASA